MRYSKGSTVMTLTFCVMACAAPGVAPAPLPPLPPAALEPLIGEYGATESLLTVYEDHGRLFADGMQLRRTRLKPMQPRRYVGATAAVHVNFEGAGADRAVAVVLNGTRLPFRDIGAEVVASIRAGTQANATAVRAAALGETPPSEPAARRAADLIDLRSLQSSFQFDIRYAAANNFMGFPLYERPDAYLQRPAAEALRRVGLGLRAKGYGLLIHDAYRPWFVTKMFWDATPVAAHVFVADPAAGSRHNRGCAVDLTLYDLTTGKAAIMTSRYDEMSHRSFADYVGGTSRERWLRDLLRSAMEQQGFSVYAQEWWHFDYKDWQEYGLGNTTFERLEAARAREP